MPEIVEHDALLFNVIRTPSGKYRRDRIREDKPMPEGWVVVDPGPYNLNRGYYAAEYYNVPEQSINLAEELYTNELKKKADQPEVVEYAHFVLELIAKVREYRKRAQD